MSIREFLFENTSTKQTVAKNTFWLVFGNIGSRLIRAIIIIYAARILGAAGWGAFSYALSLAAFFTIFIDLGINAVMTREGAKDPTIQEKYFSTSLAIKLFLLILIVAAIFLFSPYFVRQEEVLALIPIVILIVGFDSLRDFGAALSRAWEKMEIEAAIQILTNVLIVIGGFFAIFFSPTPRAFAIGYAIGTGGGMLAAFYPFRRYFKNLWQNFNLKLIRPILYASWPFGMLGLLGAVMLNTDTIMIGWFREITAVGYYTAGQRVIMLFLMISGLVTTAFFPTMAKLSHDKEKFRLLLEKSLALLSSLAVPLAIGGFILGSEVIKIVYGNEYLPATWAFKIMSLTLIPSFVSTAMGSAAFALNMEKKIAAYAVLGITGNFVFNLLLIPPFGIEGSAVSTLIVQIIILFYMRRIVKKKMSFEIFNKLKKIITASIIMAVLVIIMAYFEINPYAIIIIGASIYFLALIKMKEDVIVEIKNLFLKKA